ncbi:MAG: hypothetical protein ACEPOZ_06175 [Marinifilaceae bacterium]
MKTANIKICSVVLIFLLGILSSCTKEKKIFYVNHDASGNQSGESWQDAFTDIQPALEAASTGDSIWIAAGTYIPPNDTGFIIRKPLHILGGFKGTEKYSKDREYKDSLDWKFLAHETIISGDKNRDDDVSKWNPRLVEDANSKSHPWSACNMKDNCTHLFFAKDKFKEKIVIDGLKLTGGVADGGGIHHNGGGIAISSPLDVINCDIQSCYAVNNGGGVCYEGNDLLVKNTLFHECWSNNGGGIYNSQTGKNNLILDHNLFYGCHAASVGGGVAQFSEITASAISNTRIVNNIFNACSAYASSSTSDGGGLYQKIKQPVKVEIKKGHNFLIHRNNFYKCHVNKIDNRARDSDATGGGLSFNTTTNEKYLKKINFEVSKNRFFNCYLDAVRGRGGGAYLMGPVHFKGNVVRFCYSYNSNKKIDSDRVNVQGGGIYAINAHVDECYICSCDAYWGSGGGVYCNGDAKVTGSKIINCSAADNGGCIYACGSNVIKNCLLANGTADNGGGFASYYKQYQKKIFVIGCTVTNCWARNTRGAIYSYTDTEVHESVIFNNSAKKVGHRYNTVFERQVGNTTGLSGTKLYLADCAISGFTEQDKKNHDWMGYGFTKFRNILKLEKKNKPHADKNGLYVHFKHPIKYLGRIDAYNLKSEKSKKTYNDILNADWSMEEVSPCGDWGCSENVVKLNKEIWKI